MWRVPRVMQFGSTLRHSDGSARKCRLFSRQPRHPMSWNTANQQQRDHTLLLAPHRKKNLFFFFLSLHLSCSNPCFINSWRYIARMIPPSDHVCAIHMKARDPVYYNSNARRRNTTLLSDLLFIAFFLLLQKLVGRSVRNSEDRRRDII